MNSRISPLLIVAIAAALVALMMVMVKAAGAESLDWELVEATDTSEVWHASRDGSYIGYTSLVLVTVDQYGVWVDEETNAENGTDSDQQEMLDFADNRTLELTESLPAILSFNVEGPISYGSRNQYRAWAIYAGDPANGDQPVAQYELEWTGREWTFGEVVDCNLTGHTNTCVVAHNMQGERLQEWNNMHRFTVHMPLVTSQ